MQYVGCRMLDVGCRMQDRIEMYKSSVHCTKELIHSHYDINNAV